MKKNNILWDKETDIEKKLEWLVHELTLEEKFNMLSSGSGGLDRLGIPDLRLGGEAAHGVEARNDQNGIGEADITTSFPQPVGMSASWDKEAIKAAGKVTGREARICYYRRPWGGISRWAPTVDLLRDPRWGRNEEGYGEDPYQVGTMAAAYVQGIQGDDKDHLTAAATLKHFYANNTEIGRGWKNASISPRNKYELYLEPFRRCIEEGGAEGIMTAYNRINGVQGLFNEDVKNLLKEEFGLTHAVSDGGAMELAASFSHVTAMDAETAARSIKAGVDALSGRPEAVCAAVTEAYGLGLLSEEDLDSAIKNVYRTKIRLGLFEERDDRDLLGELCDKEAQRICKDLTDRSIVLLKNESMLPLDKEELKDCVLIGPVGDKWYYDWYGGEAPEKVTLRDGLKEALSEAGINKEPEFYDGCDRIRLKYRDKYLASDPENRIILADKGDTFVVEDWGEGSYTFRSEESGKYMITRLSGGDEDKDSPWVKGKVRSDATRIFSWFDLEVFRFENEEEGRYILRDRFGNRLYADKNGFIVSAVEDNKELEPLVFEKEIVSSGIEEAVMAASKAGVVILALGHNPMVNAKEEIDRSTIEFIPYQQKLFDELHSVNENIAVILMSDYPFAINELNRKAKAIVLSATGSQCMGRSLADALTGKVHPAGRLTQTWFVSDKDIPDIDDYDIIGKERTYRFFEGNVLYPFGYGLTYTSFEYSDIKVSVEHRAKHFKECTEYRRSGQPDRVYDMLREDERILHIELNVTNKGKQLSDEVVQIYAKAPEGYVKRPIKQLIGFERVRDIEPGETREVIMDIPVTELAYYDVISESLAVAKGIYEIKASSSSADPGVTCSISIEGMVRGSRDMSKRIRAAHYDEACGIQIVEGMYGYSALMPEGPDVYEPSENGRISVTYSDCDIPVNAQYFRIHGFAPSDVDIVVYIDDRRLGSVRLNTRDYDKNPSEERNHMSRAVRDAEMRKMSWPLLWADIHIPLDMQKIEGDDLIKGRHVIRVEAVGPFKYDWISMC